MRTVLSGVFLLCLTGLSWSEPCSVPLPDQCSNLGCVNDEMRSCEYKADVKRLSQTPAGKENINICLRKALKEQSKALTVDAVVAALVTCQNMGAAES